MPIPAEILYWPASLEEIAKADERAAIMNIGIMAARNNDQDGLLLALKRWNLSARIDERFNETPEGATHWLEAEALEFTEFDRWE